jgi:steroid delta-isomerase-like uncharacterized protein
MKRLLCFVSLVLLVCFTFACQNKAEKAELEKFRTQAKVEEQNKEVFRKVVEECNKGNYEFLRDVYAPDYVGFLPSESPKSMSTEEVIELLKIYRGSFPDLHYSVKESVAVGDLVITRSMVTGTHRGEFQGIPATGNRVEFSSINMCRLRDGKIVEERQEDDVLGMMQQLGMELKPKEAEKK